MPQCSFLLMSHNYFLVDQQSPKITLTKIYLELTLLSVELPLPDIPKSYYKSHFQNHVEAGRKAAHELVKSFEVTGACEKATVSFHVLVVVASFFSCTLAGPKSSCLCLFCSLKSSDVIDQISCVLNEQVAELFIPRSRMKKHHDRHQV